MAAFLRSLLLLAVGFFVWTAFEARADEPWHILAGDEWVSVSVEKALYEKPGHPNFFLHIAVANLTPRSLGVDLSSYWKVIRPNQWGMNDQPTRGEVDEARSVQTKLDEAAQDKLKAAYRDSALPSIAPGATLDYFINFNNGGRQSLEKQQPMKYCLVVMDGLVLVTDGYEVDTLSLLKLDAAHWKEDQMREVPISTPIVWKTLPDKAIVITDR